MANRLYLIENRSFAELDAARQSHVETACQHIPGARVSRFASVSHLMGHSEFVDGVLVVPIVTPKFDEDVLGTLATVQKHQPTRPIFGIQFLLHADMQEFDPASLSNGFWVEALDKFYDQAVPTSFVVLYQDTPQVQSFQIVASISGLFRDVDSLLELRRLGGLLSEIERRVNELEGGGE